MNKKAIASQLLVTCLATFVSAAVVMLIWNVVFHGEPVVDWGTAVVLAVAVGVSLTVSEVWNRKHRAQA